MKMLTNWKIQLFSFVFIFCVCFFSLSIDKVVTAANMHNNNLTIYFLLEWISCAFLLYLLCFPLMYVLENTEKRGLLKPKNIAIVILTAVILHIFFQIILWPILDYSVDLTQIRALQPRRDKLKLTQTQIINYSFFLFISFNWLAFIYSFKIYKNNKRDLEQKLSIEKNLKEANLNTLKGQINPHFIFNSLNNIRGLVQEDPIKSKEMITRLSELLRSSLLSGKTNTISLEQELETVENFLEISKIQYEDRLQYTLQIAPETLPLQIPPMILQMLVENAIKHGISVLKDGGNVLIQTYLENSNFHIKVTNTGNLSTNETGTKIGIKNIEERLHLLYDHHAKFQLTEHKNQVVAQISIDKNSLDI